jgi:ribosomal protein S12 methylthiotransferase
MQRIIAKNWEKLAVINLGCSKNQVDGEQLATCLSDAYDVITDLAAADILIVNTCAFVEEARAEAVETITAALSYKEQKPTLKVYVAGCLAQRYAQELAEEMPELDGILPALSPVASAQALLGGAAPSTAVRRPLLPYTAYLKIAEGCDNRCSYCVIPLIKGAYRSRPFAEVLAEAEQLARSGVKELILVAQDITRYGSENGGTALLPRLVREIAALPGLAWVRLLYAYPDMVTEELIVTMRDEPRVCHYLDIPLQHGDDAVLRRMNRRCTTAQSEELIARLRRAIPDIVLRTTVITGFPGETEQEFARLLSFVQRVRFDKLGVFTYSQEEGTAAAELVAQVPEPVRRARQEAVLAAQEVISAELNSERCGQVLDVLLEEKWDADTWLGRSYGEAPEVDGQVFVRVQKEPRVGDILPVRITKSDVFDLHGYAVGSAEREVLP